MKWSTIETCTTQSPHASAPARFVFSRMWHERLLATCSHDRTFGARGSPFENHTFRFPDQSHTRKWLSTVVDRLPMRDVAYIALGSNVGDRDAFLAFARERLAALASSRIVAVSSVEETTPLGNPRQGRYLNQMVALETDLTPEELLDALQGIERSAGRERRERWGPRTLDLDIVMFERQVVANGRLVVPHPELPHRDFWRRELAEVRPAVQ
jgi:2-amino-4-hydroxy-6-hydroxymethyldihydropteridine diphosphokinase